MGRFVTLDGAKTGPAVHVVDPGVPLETLVIDPRDLWRTQPSVRKVVNFAARNIASIPIHAYRRIGEDSRERERGGAIGALLRKPAPFTTPYRFWHTIHVDGMLTDRWCFTRLAADDRGPEMLFRIPPSRFTIKKDDFAVPVQITVKAKDGTEFHLPPEVCVFDSGYSSAWGDPVPPADALSDLLNESKEQTQYRRELLVNGARMSGVIERPLDAKEWTDPAWERFTRQFAQYKAGGGKAGGVPVLEDGMTFKPLEAFNPQSMEILEARKLTDAEVASFWHIPPELVGSREGTFANLEAMRQMLWNVSLGPAIIAFEQALDVMLLPQLSDDEDLYVEALVEAKLRGSFEEQLRAGQAAVGAPYMTRNEFRAKMNLPRIEGGDELITPLNVVAGGLASPLDTGTPGNGKGDDAPIKGELLGGTKADDGTPEWAKGISDYDRELDSFYTRLKATWEEEAEELALVLLSDGTKAETSTVFDEKAYLLKVEPIVRAHMIRLAELGAWDVLKAWDPEATGWGPQMVEAWIAKAAATNASMYASAAQTEVSRALESEDRQVAVLALGGAAFVGTMATLFATEARSFGSQDAARKTGLATKTWHTNSKAPRPEHAALNGVTIPIDEVFAIGVRWPGDSMGDAEDNANCRCSLTYGKAE